MRELRQFRDDIVRRRFEATHTDFDLYEQGCEGLVGECTQLYEGAMDPALYLDVSKIADANRDARRGVRIHSKSHQRPPSAVSDGHESYQ